MGYALLYIRNGKHLIHVPLLSLELQKNIAADNIVNIEKNEFWEGRELTIPESLGSINLILISAV